MQIWPNVYWLSGRSSNMYLCDDEDGLTLIDSGMPRELDLILDGIQAVGRRPADLIRILITHADMDHAGSAAELHSQTKTPVYAGHETAKLIQMGSSPKHMPWPVQFVIDHFISYPAVPGTAIKLYQDQELLPVLGGLQILATPGHTADHHSFYSPTAGVLFAGDALRTEGGRLRSSPKRITADQNAARRSAIRLLALAPAVIACGHGEPMSQHGNDEIMDLFNELRRN